MKELVKGKLRKDYTGKNVNGHKCLKYIGHKNGDAYYEFECKSCGREFITKVSHAKKFDGCGCIRIQIIKEKGRKKGKQNEMLNKTFGLLTTLREDPIRRENIHDIYYYVQCGCGSPEFSVKGYDLKSGSSTSCGCKSRSNSCNVFLEELEKRIEFPIESREVPLSEFIDTNKKYRYDAIIPQLHILIEVDAEHTHGTTKVFSSPDTDEDKNEYANLLGYELYRFICNSVEDIPMAMIRNSYMINKLKARLENKLSP